MIKLEIIFCMELFLLGGWLVGGGGFWEYHVELVVWYMPVSGIK